MAQVYYAQNKRGLSTSAMNAIETIYHYFAGSFFPDGPSSVKRNSGFPHFASLFISFPYFYLLFFGILLLALGRQASTSKITTKGTIKGILQTSKQVQSRIIIE